MKFIRLYLILLLLANSAVNHAQGHMGEMPPRKKETPKNVHDRLRIWNMVDDFTYADSAKVDTSLAGYQVDNEMFKYSFSNTFTGNTGGPFTSNLLSHKTFFNEFIFVSPLRLFLIQPEDITFYNTKTPFTNMYYIHSDPSRRSEDNLQVFFTQNITKYWNFGIEYHTLSTVGLYNAQQVDNRHFKFYMSYDGDNYSAQGGVIYNKADQYENGGLLDDDHDLIIDFKELGFGQAENITMKYYDAKNKIENIQFFYNHSLGIGKVPVKKELPKQPLSLDSIPILNDSVPPPPQSQPKKEVVEQLPVSTVFHTLQISNYARNYNIEELDNYFDSDNVLRLYDNVYTDSLQTADTTKYTLIKNTFQIKFNEEANSLLRFGLRAYLSNEVKHYKFPIESPGYNDDDEVIYRNGDTTLVTTYVGGQIFKNLGKNFWWNAGAKLYFQGYRSGDMQVTGQLNTLYKVFKDTAGVYARGKLELRSAELFEQKYYSNHFVWDNSFKQEKIIDIEAGLKLPSRNLYLSWESKTMTDYLYWNQDAMPEQTSKVVSAFQVSLLKKFKLGPLHSDNKLAYQYSSDQSVYPVPEFAGFSSNYFNFYLAKRVLNIQVGVDVRYQTAFYAPAYMPATGQFYMQDDVKIGNYPFMDAFLNFRLKRARVFIKADHFNQSLGDRNYFISKGYAYQPFRLKYGISWNFYD